MPEVDKFRDDAQRLADARATLSPYIATDQWQQIKEPNANDLVKAPYIMQVSVGDYINPSYDISSIPITTLLHDEVVRSAIAEVFGTKYMDEVDTKARQFVESQLEAIVTEHDPAEQQAAFVRSGIDESRLVYGEPYKVETVNGKTTYYMPDEVRVDVAFNPKLSLIGLSDGEKELVASNYQSGRTWQEKLYPVVSFPVIFPSSTYL